MFVHCDFIVLVVVVVVIITVVNMVVVVVVAVIVMVVAAEVVVVVVVIVVVVLVMVWCTNEARVFWFLVTTKTYCIITASGSFCSMLPLKFTASILLVGRSAPYYHYNLLHQYC
ncbi:hypothetical protein ElyMa_004978200 [Elysia marginata]|uniref:Uncharacterized protein n=1 Tax=Elysia marginata TaxID=1093978 RepID=A0AAV4J4L5_9GAST|nr:hypothetical protein ElyMa_004978200 [Elysia marginata]